MHHLRQLSYPFDPPYTGAPEHDTCDHCNTVVAEAVRLMGRDVFGIDTSVLSTDDVQRVQALAQRFLAGHVLSREACRRCAVMTTLLWQHAHSDPKDGTLGKLDYLSVRRQYEAALLTQETRTDIDALCNKFADKILAALDTTRGPVKAKWARFNVCWTLESPAQLQSREFVEAFIETRFAWYTPEQREFYPGTCTSAINVETESRRMANSTGMWLTDTIRRIVDGTSRRLERQLATAHGNGICHKWKIRPVRSSAIFDRPEQEPCIVGLEVKLWKRRLG